MAGQRGTGFRARHGRTAVALAIGATLTAGLGGALTTASAEQRTITVTLLGGKVITLTVDVPPGTPLDQIALPPALAPLVTVTAEKAPATIPQAAPDKKPAAGAKAKHDKAKHKPAHKTDVPAAKHRAHRMAVKKVSAAPSAADPTFSYALPGPAPVGVPNFFIDRFRIPPFLLPIYQAAGSQYGVRWEVLAAINEIETDYGRNLSVSTAGAEGWMQFMPGTWKYFGVDANRDGVKDPYNPVDAIFAAARYLKAAGAEKNIRTAIFAYNHADWYVDSVLMRARLIAGLPADLVGSLTGLTEGRFPVAAASRYVRGSQRGLNIYARTGARVIAVADATVTKMGTRRTLGRFIQVRDPFGNTYTYSHLARVMKTYALPAARRTERTAIDLPANDPSPSMAASAGRQAASRRRPAKARAAARVAKERLFAHPRLVRGSAIAGTVFRAGKQARRARLRVGSHVIAGTVLGRLGVTAAGPSHVRFSIRPAGKAAPLIDPKPILDGWKLLESTAIYRANGRNALMGAAPSIGQVLLMTKQQLQRRVLADPNVSIYPGGIDDIRAGQVDRRVLAALEFLSASGLKPTVSCLITGHSLRTTSGNISEHASGNAVDISAINGIPILGHQGRGSIADLTIRRLLTLQGGEMPHQIISLMTYAGAANTIALPDHADHIHIGFSPQASAILKPLQWTRLLDRLGKIDNPAITG